MIVSPHSESRCLKPSPEQSLWRRLCLVLLACAWLAPGIWGQTVTPPAPPSVAPAISRTYSGDLNGNCINDDLEAARRSLQGYLHRRRRGTDLRQHGRRGTGLQRSR